MLTDRFKFRYTANGAFWYQGGTFFYCGFTRNVTGGSERCLERRRSARVIRRHYRRCHA